MFLKVDEMRLQWHRENQAALRVAYYTRLREDLGDSLNPDNEDNLVRTGRLCILPSTYIGGDRYMNQNMNDAIAMSTKFGHPDIFITMTCNPKWDEITR